MEGISTNVIIFILVLVFLLFLILFSFKPKPKSYIRSGKVILNRGVVKEKWQKIEELMRLGRPSNFKTAILEADKLVDYVLRGLGVSGETMGDRLKSARPRFLNYDTYNDLWFAHKVRNDLVHDIDHELLSYEAKKAVEGFKRALEELRML
ncbi:MAG: hypothetical protein GTN40_03035 [Candidatus Aenigmarchaeota archaeon]|nr:hypothetical protein [Candidatus Aenigmarchaeota archaeon]